MVETLDVELVDVDIVLIEDGVNELVDVEVVDVGSELDVYDQEPVDVDDQELDDAEDQGPVGELAEESLDVVDVDTLETDMILELTGNMLLVELTTTVVVVAPAAIVVKVSVSTSRPTTPSLRVWPN